MSALDKQRAIVESGAAQHVQEFLDWLLDDAGFQLSKWNNDPADSGIRPDRLVPARIGRGELMAQFFGIDPAKVEAERHTLLDQLRTATPAALHALKDVRNDD